jgi:hypothetical protein
MCDCDVSFSWRDQIIRDFRATVPEHHISFSFPLLVLGSRCWTRTFISTTVLGTSWSWLFSKPIIWLRALEADPPHRTRTGALATPGLEWCRLWENKACPLGAAEIDFDFLRPIEAPQCARQSWTFWRVHLSWQ